MTPRARIIYPYAENEKGDAELLPEKQFKKNYPRAFAHLFNFRDKLRKRLDSRKLYATGSSWYRFLRPGTFSYIRPPKLIIKGIDTRASIGLLGEKTAFNGANCPAIIISDSIPTNENYILGILNSRLLSYFLRSICPAKLGGYTRFNATSVSRSPIRLLDVTARDDRNQHDRLVKLVDQMLTLHQQLAKAKSPADRSGLEHQIAATDRQIDRLVYELYELTEEEIAIVEEGTKA